MVRCCSKPSKYSGAERQLLELCSSARTVELPGRHSHQCQSMSLVGGAHMPAQLVSNEASDFGKWAPHSSALKVELPTGTRRRKPYEHVTIPEPSYWKLRAPNNLDYPTPRPLTICGAGSTPIEFSKQCFGDEFVWEPSCWPETLNPKP